MTVYYDPQRPIILSILTSRHSTFKAVVKRGEFWFYLVLHTAMMLTLKYSSLKIGAFPWDAVGAMQFFLMFMLIFYNEHCYQRYMTFYPACMNALHSSMLFVQELVISFPFYEVRSYRLTASRYILAAVYLFYMNVTGGLKTGTEWQEVTRKGLLTKKESAMLQEYPGGRVTLVLTSWALQTCEYALRQDCFHQKTSPHTAHAFNRLNAHVVDMVRFCHRISYLLALPIPYPYYHILNYIMVCNFCIIALALATFKNFLSILAFGFALLIYLGLREVSIELADPFDEDEVDFPIAEFLDYAFDHSISLLEAFSDPKTYERVYMQVEHAQPFNDEQMLRVCAQTQVFDTKSRGSVNQGGYGWDKPLPLQQLEKGASAKVVLSHVLIDPAKSREALKHGHSLPRSLSAHAMTESERNELHQFAEEDQAEVVELRKELNNLNVQLESLNAQLSDLPEKEEDYNFEEDPEDIELEEETNENNDGDQDGQASANPDADPPQGNGAAPASQTLGGIPEEQPDDPLSKSEFVDTEDLETTTLRIRRKLDEVRARTGFKGTPSGANRNQAP